MGSNKVPLREGIYYNSVYSCLECPAGEIHLTPNEKKMLGIILDGRGKKDTLIEEIWHQQGVIVSESSYHQLVKMLRRKFVAAGLPPSCLKTISRYGIVFVSESDPKENENSALCDINLSLHDGTVQKDKDANSQRQQEMESVEVRGLVMPFSLPGNDAKPHSASLSSLLKYQRELPSIKVSYTVSAGLFLFSILFVLLILTGYHGEEYFTKIKKIDRVSYYTSPTAKMSELLWQRIEHKVMPVTTNVYIASNGPKFWIAYCENSIYKENVPCTYEHFSAY